MEELSYEAKIAVIRILKDILAADNIIQEVEVEYMNQVSEIFGLNDEDKEKADVLVTLQALGIIKGLATPQKEMIAQLMGKMIIIDKDINYNEVKLYNAVCESCDIEKDFNVINYPDYTLSGPFMNPEDLMNCI